MARFVLIQHFQILVKNIFIYNFAFALCIGAPKFVLSEHAFHSL